MLVIMKTMERTRNRVRTLAEGLSVITIEFNTRYTDYLLLNEQTDISVSEMKTNSRILCMVLSYIVDCYTKWLIYPPNLSTPIFLNKIEP